MRNLFKPLGLVALLAFGSPLVAQEADPAPTDPAADLSMGTPVEDTGPAVGETYIGEAFGDWSHRCLKTETGDDPCQLYQLLSGADGNPVAEFSMYPLPEGASAAAGVTIMVPLGTLLTAQLTLSVDGANPRQYPFTFCHSGGCVSRVGLSAEEVAEFKNGGAATLTLVPVVTPDTPVTLTVSLVGFTAGFDATEVPPQSQ